MDKLFNIASDRFSKYHFLNHRQCHTCYRELASDARFCDMCGTRVETRLTPRIETRTRVEYVKVCPRCGFENNLDAISCHGMTCTAKFTIPHSSRIDLTPIKDKSYLEENLFSHELLKLTTRF